MSIINGIATVWSIIENVFRFLKKEKPIEVKPKFEKVETPTKIQSIFTVYVINNYNVSLEIIGIGYITKKGEDKSFTKKFVELPVTIAPGRSHGFVFDPKEILSDKPKKIWVIEHRDKTYYSGYFQTRKVLKYMVKKYQFK